MEFFLQRRRGRRGAPDLLNLAVDILDLLFEADLEVSRPGVQLLHLLIEELQIALVDVFGQAVPACGEVGYQRFGPAGVLPAGVLIGKEDRIIARHPAFERRAVAHHRARIVAREDAVQVPADDALGRVFEIGGVELGGRCDAAVRPGPRARWRRILSAWRCRRRSLARPVVGFFVLTGGQVRELLRILE